MLMALRFEPSRFFLKGKDIGINLATTANVIHRTAEVMQTSVPY